MLYLLCALAVLVPLTVTTQFSDAVVLPKLVLTSALVGASVVWAGVLLFRGSPALRSPPRVVLIPLVLFVCVNIVAAATAADWRSSLIGEDYRYQGLATILVYVLLAGLAYSAVRSKRQLSVLLWAVFLGALGVAVYALIQQADLDWVEWSGRSTSRPFSTLGQANALGAYLVTAMCAVTFLFFTTSRLAPKALLVVGFAMMAWALLFTLSRSAYLSASAAIVLFGLAALFTSQASESTRGKTASSHVPRDRRLLLTAIGLLLLPLTVGAVLLFLDLPKGRVAVLSQENNEPVDARLSLWRLGAEMTMDRPFFGYGQDAFSTKFPTYRDSPNLPGIRTRSLDPESSHSFVLDLSVGTGLVGLASFLWLVGAALWISVKRVQSTEDVELRVALVATGTSVVAYLLAVTFGFMEAMTTWLLWLILGAMLGLAVPSPARNGSLPHEPTPARSRTSGGALVVMGVGILFWAATITAADVAANRAESSAARWSFQTAADQADLAVRLNPLRRQYLALKGESYLLAARILVDPDERASAVEEASNAYETLSARFHPTAQDALRLALLRLDGSPERDPVVVVAMLEEVVRLDPYSATVRLSVAAEYERRGMAAEALLHRVEVLCWNNPCD